MLVVLCDFVLCIDVDLLDCQVFVFFILKIVYYVDVVVGVLLVDILWVKELCVVIQFVVDDIQIDQNFVGGSVCGYIVYQLGVDVQCGVVFVLDGLVQVDEIVVCCQCV